MSPVYSEGGANRGIDERRTPRKRGTEVSTYFKATQRRLQSAAFAIADTTGRHGCNEVAAFSTKDETSGA